MPRKARLNVTGSVAHIMTRSLSSEVLFGDDEDRFVFVSLLEKYLSLVNYRCYAWVLLSNHYHLVVRTSEQNLSELMRPLNTSYAQYHKKKYRRDGPLFRDRYKSIITQDQKYIEELVRYVHLNPIRAGICKDLSILELYPWSGHSVLMGRKKCLFQDTITVLRRFGDDNNTARNSLMAFLLEGLKTRTSDDALFLKLVRDSNKGKERGRDASCWVIGDRDFVKKVVLEAEKSIFRLRRFEKEGCTLESIAKKVEEKLNVPVDKIRSRCRGGTGSKARKIFVYTAVIRYGVPSKIVAEFCGIGLAAVSAMVREGASIAKSYNFTI